MRHFGRLRAFGAVRRMERLQGDTDPAIEKQENIYTVLEDDTWGDQHITVGSGRISRPRLGGRFTGQYIYKYMYTQTQANTFQ